MISIDKFARRLDKVEEDLLAVSTRPQLGYSAIDSGALEVRDIHGNLTGVIGTQFDGTTTAASVGGTWPVAPTMPYVEPTIGGLKMYWDGTYEDGSIARMDFKRVTFHAVTDIDDLDVLVPAQIVGEVTIATGGEAACWLPPIEHFVVAVAWTEAGKFSIPSAVAFATPLAGTSAEQWEEHEEALASRVRISNDEVQPTGLTEADRVLWYDPLNDNAISYWDGTAWGPYVLGGGAIAPSSIDTIHLNSKSVTAEILDAEVLRAGFTLTGRLQVGETYITPEEGIVIPQPDGSATRFPSDGLTTAQISGHVKAKSLSIEKDLTLNGTTNQIQGVVKLANGITAPASEPSLYQSWDTRYSSVVDNTPYGSQTFRGACQSSIASAFAVAVNYFGAGIRLVDKNNGNIAAYPDPTVGKSWTSSFSPRGGIGFANSHYFLYGQEIDGIANAWYVLKINENFDEVARYWVGNYTVHNENQMRIYASSATGGVHVVFCNNENQVRMLTWDTNLAFLHDRLLYTAAGARNIEALYVGPADFGGNKVMVGVREDGVVYGWDYASNGRETQWDFYMGNGAKIQGLHYDTGLGKFLSYDQQGRIVHYSTYSTNRSIAATYTWYDGEGTTHETNESPVRNFTLPARANLVIETPPAPDSGVTDPTRVDKANRIGIYAGIDGGARRRQAYLGLNGDGTSIRSMIANPLNTSNPTAPGSNTFASASASPGTLISAASDADGPLLELSGAGTLKVEGRRIYANPILSRTFGSLGAMANPVFNGTRAVVYERGAVTVPTGARMAHVVCHAAARATINSNGNWELFVGTNAIPYYLVDQRWFHNEGDQYKSGNTTLSGWVAIPKGTVHVYAKVEAAPDAAGGGWNVSPGGMTITFFG